MKLAQIQMRVGPDKAANLRHAEALLAQAADADMAVLPEMFCCPYDNACFRAYGEPEGGPAYQMLSRAAAAHGLWVVGGSLPELDGDKVYNTSYVFDPTAAAWPVTGRCTFSTSTWPAVSDFASLTPCRQEMRSRCLTRPGAKWGCASALTCGFRSWHS